MIKPQALLCQIASVILLIPLANSQTPIPREVVVQMFQKDFNDCIEQAGADVKDIHNFLDKVPQTNSRGQCLVGCVLERNDFLVFDKINVVGAKRFLNRTAARSPEVLSRAVDNCVKTVESENNPCSMASLFNDCLNSARDMLRTLNYFRLG